MGIFSIYDNLISESVNNDQMSNRVKDFVKFATNEIGFNKMVPVKLTTSHDELTTTAHYDPGKEIVIYINNRATVDVFRSIAHEMQHHKQFEQNRLIGKIQDIGGEIENEANAVAGILIKKYALAGNRKMYTESINRPPITVKVKKNRHGDYDLDIPAGSVSYDTFTDLYTSFSNGATYGISYDYKKQKATLSVTPKGLEELKQKPVFNFNLVLGDNQLNEGASAVITPKGTFKDNDRKTYPFYYYYGVLYVGREGGNHTQIGLDHDLVDDCLPDDPTPEEEEEAEENNWDYCSEIAGNMTVDGETQYNGRIFEIPKIISFWSDITKEQFSMVIKDLNNGGFKIDDTWQMNYMDNIGGDKYIPIGEYLGHVANDETLRKLKQLAQDHIKGKKDRGGKRPIKLNPTGSDRNRIKQLLRNQPELRDKFSFEQKKIKK